MSAQTKRDYLVTLGLAKPGVRGRFSKDGVAALAAAEANGVVFADTPKPEPKPKAPKADKPKVSLVKGPKRVKPAKPETLAEAKQDQFLAKPVPQVKALRKQETLYAIAPVGQTHVRIGYVHCSAPTCGRAIQYCECAGGPKAPKGSIPVPSYPKV